MADADPLRLLVESPDDLKIVSAAVQDALMRAGDLKYDQRRRRFTLELNRFRWETAAGRRKKGGERVRAVLGFDGVLAVRSRGVTKTDPDMILSLLSVTFTEGDAPPAGKLDLTFAGDGEIVLEVECLDAMLVDTDAVWDTRRRPEHDRTSR